MIEAGDWVIVDKPTLCCGRTDWIGTIYQVLLLQKANCNCLLCKAKYPGIVVAQTLKSGYHISEVRKLKPLSEEEKFMQSINEKIDQRIEEKA